MIPFFITGLPRSRTAWLANWLTTDASLVYHDVPLPMDLRGEWKQIGFSGPELVAEYEAMTRLYPGAKWLVVLRAADDARQSFLRWSAGVLPPNPAFDELWRGRVEALARLTLKPNVKTVAFGDLEDCAQAAQVWHHLLPAQEFDAERWRVLNEMNVQQMLQKGMKRWQQAA